MEKLIDTIEKHFTNNRMVLNLHGDLGNNNSYAIIVDGEQVHYELMDEKNNVMRFSTPEALRSEMSARGLTTSINLDRAGRAMQAFSDIANKVIYTGDSVINYAELMRTSGQNMLGTSAHRLGCTLISQSIYRADRLDRNAGFIDSYLSNLDKTVSEAIVSLN